MPTREEQRLRDALTVAHLHYTLGWDQTRIAEELNKSQPTISRLLRYAQQFVEVKISGPATLALEAMLIGRYGLRDVHVIEHVGHNPAKATGLVAATAYRSSLTGAKTLLCSGGPALLALANALPYNRRANSLILSFSLEAESENGYPSSAIVSSLIARFHRAKTCGIRLPRLGTTSDTEYRQSLRQSDWFRQLREQALAASHILLDFGEPPRIEPEDSLALLTEEEIAQLARDHHRTVVGLAYDWDQLPTINQALTSGLINQLVVSSSLANALA